MTARGENALSLLRGLQREEQLEVIARAVSEPSLHRPDVDVDVAPLRERFLILRSRDGVSPEEAALRAGWLFGSLVNGVPRGDGTRLLRRLGLLASCGSSGWTVTRFVSYETAVVLCDALDVDYTEVGV